MKQFILITFLAALALAGQAQRASVMPLILGDTIVNTGTVTKTLPPLTASYSGLILQVNYVKISGTGAGTAQLQISLDGTNYTNSGSAYTITNTFPQSNQFTVAAPLGVYARILFTGSGTESVVPTVYYVARKYTITNY